MYLDQPVKKLLEQVDRKVSIIFSSLYVKLSGVTV